jgi:hypothetical protein
MRLAPAAFDPDIATGGVAPAARFPTNSTTGRGDIGARDPDITRAVPTVIAGAPRPIGMAVRTDGNNFAGRWGRSDTDGNLSLDKTSGQQEAANDREEYFLH